jgi:xanthine permease
MGEKFHFLSFSLYFCAIFLDSKRFFSEILLDFYRNIITYDMKQSIENLYKLDGRVPVGKALPFGLQHVLAMFVSNIAPIMILAGAVGLDSSISAVLIQNCMVIAGIGTLVQLYPVWRIGSRLPIVMGISFTFLSLAISIAAAHGMGTLIGAVIIGGLVEGTLGLFAKYWIKLIPPVVAATVVTAIGFSLLPVGANSFAGAVGLDSSISAVLIQNCMVIAGIGTLVQLYPVWRIGSRLPIVMGISFTFLSLAISIAAAHGMGTLIGAVIIGGLVEGTLGLFAKYWIKLIPPVVAATVVTAIGFSLLPVGANSFAGGQGAADFGSMNNWIVGSVTLLACLLCQIFAKGFLRSLSVLVGLIVGYILACFMGMIDYSGLTNLSIIALPRILPFTPEFNIGAILSVVAVYLVSATETIGDTSALCNSALKRDPNTKEMGAAVCCDGFVSSVSGLFGCTPITSFSQNVGLAAMSGVVNRFTIAMGAIIMIIGGIFPAIGYVLTTIPQAVLGGCTIMMFGSILFAGFGMMARTGFSQRNMVIVSLSLSVGLGFTQATGMFNIFPEIVRTVFADNCVAVVFLLAVILNLVLPKNLEK